MNVSPRFSPLAAPIPLAVALALAAVPGARADESAENQSPTAGLQEIVVTAQKIQEKLHDVPMGVTAITPEEMDKEQITDLMDIQSKVPALAVEQIAPGQDRLTLRGENVGSVGSTVTTYVDDTPFGSSNALANGSLLAGDFETWDLQRVEVLRGPQGTLYGAGSEGGLLKYVTNAPDPSRFAAAVQVGDADVAHGQNGASGKVMANVPLGDSAAFRVSGYYEELPGFIDDPTLNEKDINRGYRSGLRAGFFLQASDHFSIRLSAFGQTVNTDGTNYVDVVGANGTPLTPPANQLQPDHGAYDQERFINEPSTYRYRVYSGSLDWNYDWGSVTSITSYGITQQDLYSDASSIAAAPGFSYGDFVSSILKTNAGVAEQNNLNVTKSTEEVRIASPAGQALEWQLGGFYTRESSELVQGLPIFLIPSQTQTGLSLESPTLDALYKEKAAFGWVKYHFTPALDLEVGGRWSKNTQSVDEAIGGLLYNPPQLTGGSSSGSDFTYSIAPTWKFNDDTMAYARVASGYRPGGPNALPPGVPAGVALTYGSDSTINYELGTRTYFLDHAISIDVAAFLIQWKKIQLLEIVDNFGIDANGGTAHSKGFEWQLGWAPVKGLKFAFTGAYIDANLTSNAPAAGGNDGDVLPYAPKLSTSIDGSYTWHAFGDFSGFGGATWSYYGSRWDDFSATTEVVSAAVVAIPNPRVELPSYSLVNLRAGLQNSTWTMELYIKNLSDERGIATYDNGGSPGFGGSIGITEPRTVGATVTLRF